MTNKNDTPKRHQGRPPARVECVRAAYKIKACRAMLGLPETLLTFRTIAAALSERSGIVVTAGTVHRFANGIEPKRNDLRHALGLPVTAPAPVCPRHGVVHVSRRCPADNSKPRQKRRNWRGMALVLAGLIVNSGFDFDRQLTASANPVID